jgi:ribosomal protein L16/L10AE
MPKSTILVCQHLEKISRKALENYQDIIRKYVRRQGGVGSCIVRHPLQNVMNEAASDRNQAEVGASILLVVREPDALF